MNLLCRPLVPLLLLCWFPCLPAARGGETNPATNFICLPVSELHRQTEKRREEFKFVEPPNWQEWSGKMLRRDGQPPVKVVGKKAQCKVTGQYFGPNEFAIAPFTVFVTDGGEVWAGPEQSYYLETASGVIGIRTRSRAIEWCESLVSKQKDKTALEEILRHVESTMTAQEIRSGVKAGTDRNNSRDRFTGLDMLQSIYFCPNAVDNLHVAFSTITGLHTVNVAAIRVEGGELHMELRDGKYPGVNIPLGRYSATVWIDIKTRKVTKAIENGKQVFPK